MSRSGALIEGAVLPPVGSDVRLCRGSLWVSGRLVWAKANKAGLRFEASVVVADWLPSGKRDSGQLLIDEMVHQTRLGTPSTSPPMRSADQNPDGLKEELLRLSD